MMILLSYLLLILTDLYIIKDLKKLSVIKKLKNENEGKKIWWKIYAGFSILILIVLSIAISLPRRSISEDISGIMWLLFTVTTVITSQIFYVICSLLGRIPQLFKGRRINTGLWLGLPGGVIVFIAMWWGALVGRKQIEIVDVSISSPQLPKAFEGYKIAQISDLHVGTWGNDSTFLSCLVDSVNNHQPDLIIFTGDLVNRHADELKPFMSTLSRLKAKDGVLSILGNHDYGDYVSWNSTYEKDTNLNKLRTMQGEMGWKLLENEHLKIGKEKGDSIVIIGVGNWGEPPFTKYGDLKKAYPESALNDSNFKILLSHNPEHWNQEVSKISNIDITFAGHTHAMQMMLKLGGWKWSPSSLKYDQWGGMYTRKNNRGEETSIYVNIGAGEVGFPMRIGANPEITIITLER